MYCTFSPPSGELQLEPRGFTRDCAGYLSSLIVLMFVCGSKLEDTFDMSKWDHCLGITVGACCILIEFQVIYCVIVSNFKQVCIMLGIKNHGDVKNVAGNRICPRHNLSVIFLYVCISTDISPFIHRQYESTSA